ncbi:hypothetical protein VULLAG_LOCUS2040 [Vulpes lagopus]
MKGRTTPTAVEEGEVLEDGPVWKD